MGWILVPCLDKLTDELDEIAPNRSKKSDGSIGDAAHQASVSDHNDDEVGRVPIRDADNVHEVHAKDLTAKLNHPNLTMEDVVQFVLGRCRTKQERRLRYIIFNRRIWEASNDWKERVYQGASPHTEHAHWSASYETKWEYDVSSWELKELIKGQKMRKNDVAIDGLRLPTLRMGESDAEFGGYDMVRRVQKLVLVEADGEYGPATAAAIAKFMGSGNGKTVGINEYKKLFGLTATV